MTGTSCGPRRGRAFFLPWDRRCDRSYPPNTLKSASREFRVPRRRGGGGRRYLSGLMREMACCESLSGRVYPTSQVAVSDSSLSARRRQSRGFLVKRIQGSNKGTVFPVSAACFWRHSGICRCEGSIASLAPRVSDPLVRLWLHCPPLPISLVPLPSRPGPSNHARARAPFFLNPLSAQDEGSVSLKKARVTQKYKRMEIVTTIRNWDGVHTPKLCRLQHVPHNLVGHSMMSLFPGGFSIEDSESLR